jgi:hypothetical protein
MHSRELVELAALASAHGLALVRSGQASLPIEGLGEYWSASKCRLDRWTSALARLSAPAASAAPLARPAPDAGGQAPALPNGDLKSVLEEILISDVLTRVWTAVLAALDRRHGAEENAPIAQRILLGHAEARHRVLTLLVHGPGISSHEALRLDRLRRRSERWTDLLIGHVCNEHDVSEFAANPAVAREFAADLRNHQGWSTESQAWPLLLASLRAAFRQDVAAVSPNRDLNRRIAAGVLACLPPELFDSTGLLRSLWMTRISHAADDAQGLIASMFPCESPSPKLDSPALRAPLGEAWKRRPGN